jgi:hypothetical protein
VTEHFPGAHPPTSLCPRRYLTAVRAGKPSTFQFHGISDCVAERYATYSMTTPPGTKLAALNADTGRWFSRVVDAGHRTRAKP